MASQNNRLPHRGILAAGYELALYAETSRQLMQQITLRPWWTLEPVDYVGRRHVWVYADATSLLREHGYPRRTHPGFCEVPAHYPRPAVHPRVHRRVLAGAGEIAALAHVPTSRVALMVKSPWWTVDPIDYLAGGTVYPYAQVAACLSQRGYPRVHQTIGEKLEAASRR